MPPSRKSVSGQHQWALPLFAHETWIKFAEALEERLLKWERLRQGQVDQSVLNRMAWDLTKAIRASADDTLKTRESSRPPTQPSVSAATLSLIHDRSAALAVVQQCPDDRQAAITFQQCARAVRAAMRSERRARRERLHRSLEAPQGSGAALWSRIRKLVRAGALTPNTFLDANGQLASSPERGLAVARDYFELLGAAAPPTAQLPELLVPTAWSEQHANSVESLSRPITLQEVQSAISGLKSGSAPGPDGIPSELLKHGGPALAKAMHRLITACWASQSVPVSLCEGTIVEGSK